MEGFHFFTDSMTDILMPSKFTNPFRYVPHPLSIKATEAVQRYLSTQAAWAEELEKGKMFGVLVVRTPQGEVGFLAAFSGMLAGKNRHSFFVPPIYDLQNPQGFFKTEEKKISAINRQIDQLKGAESYIDCLKKQNELITSARIALENGKEALLAAKKQRDRIREAGPDEALKRRLIKESQFQKAELKRLKEHWNRQLAAVAAERSRYEEEISRLENERKQRSATLQKRLFTQFAIVNRNGEKKNLSVIFEDTPQKTPPAGAGECAAPRLLQQAFLHHLEPICMAEFWWGASPQGEIRRHGYYYPACKGKCEPILKHMLQGLQVESETSAQETVLQPKLEIVYEDQWILGVAKPAGMLSVPGNIGAISVYQWIREKYPYATGPLLVHRLDMATSGILLAAKTKEVHQNLQAQFKNRTIQKRYVAVLDGTISANEGTITLPLRPDPMHRPQQIVDTDKGKPAVTRFHVIARENGKTKIYFFPLTGRTHQIRVHAAHPCGLNTAIIGDELYGKRAKRLFLHAESITFQHPVTGETVTIEKKADFS